MKGSRKSAPPQEYSDWMALANEDWQPSYPFNDTAVRDAVRTSLHAEQRGLCVYCGRELKLDLPGDTYHVEHFRPRTKYKKLTVDYKNLFLSCGQKEKKLPSEICGNKKDEWFDENKHVEPIYSACTRRFRFLLTGKVVCADAADQSAEEMISRLNLNHPELVKDREAVLYNLDSGAVEVESYWDAATGKAESYGHVAFQHVGRELP